MQCTDSLFFNLFRVLQITQQAPNKFKYKNLYSVTFSKTTLKKARQCSCFAHMYSYVSVCYWYVACMYSYIPACYLYVLICTCILLVCTRVYSCGVLVTILHTGEFFQITGGTAIPSQVPLCRKCCLQNCSPRQNHSHMVKSIY